MVSVAWLGLLLMIMSGNSGLSAQPRVLTLDQAIAEAQEQNPGLERARLSMVQATGEAQSGWNLFLPEIQVGTSLNRSMFDDGGSPWTSTLSASASMGLGPGTSDRLRRRSLDSQIARLEWLQEAVSLRRNVSEAFYGVLLAEERLTIAERSSNLAEQQLQRAEALFESGRASELDLLDAQAAALELRPQILTRREALHSEELRLKEFLGLSPNDEISLSAAIEFPESTVVRTMEEPQLRDFVLTESLELALARLDQERLEISEALTAHDARHPRFSATYSYSPSFSPPFAQEQWRSAGSWETGSLSLRLTMPLDPFIPGSEGANSLQAARFATQRGLLDMEETETAIRTQLAQLTERLALSRERLAVFGESLEIAERRYRQTRAAFESGGVGLPDVENARAALERGQLNVIQERYTIVMTIIELDALAGGALLRK